MKANINLRDIKNIYNIKEIFEFLDKKLKLNIIIYNKGLELEKILDVKIEDYKEVIGKYKEGKRNGKGREYLTKTNSLIFEGEYLNGKRNGKGKEYCGDLKFEGEYLNELIFEGEYLNGKRNGKGKEYCGDLKFEGEYLNGKRNGKGKEYYDNGKLEFEGKYLNGRIWEGIGYNINGEKEFEIKDGKGY